MPEVEEEREEAEGNLNDVVYAVAVKLTLRSLSVTYCGRFQQPVLFFCVGVVQLCARSQAAGERQQIGQKEA